MSDPDLVGKTVAGRYRVTEKIGSGGMGAVYAALQEPLGRKVALKVLKPSFARDDIAIARFKKEAAIVSGLNHPNIVTLHDYGETEDGLLYIVMEYLRGATLASVRRSRTGVMPWRRTIPLVKDIVRALSAAHAAGVIHRDLKLDNVMLVEGHGDRDFVKILDFGVAKTLTVEEGAAPLTVTDSSPGTPGYMSPELARGITDDPRSDFYALGVVWFELLVGVRPFTDKNAMDLFFAQMTRPAPSIRDVSPYLKLPAPLDALIAKLLDKDPSRRPRDTKAFLEALLALEESLVDTIRADARADLHADLRADDLTATKRDDASRDPQTLPTGAGAFLPTQLGSPPPFTDAGDHAGDHAPHTETEVAPARTMPSVDADAPTDAPTAAPTDAPTAASPEANVAAATVTQLLPRRRALPFAALSVAAVAALGLVALVAIDGGRDERENVDASDARWGAPGDERPAPPVFTVVAPRPREAIVKSAPPDARTPGLVRAAPDAPADTSVHTQASAPADDAPANAPGAHVDARNGAPWDRRVSPSAFLLPAAAGAAQATTTDADALRRRLTALNELMRDRMLLPDDVPDYRRRSANVKDAIDGARGDEAAAVLTELEAALSSVRLSDAFIREKLARINAAIPAGWPREAAQVQELARLRTDVHERFGARDLPGANLALNRLWLFSLKAKMRAQNR